MTEPTEPTEPRTIRERIQAALREEVAIPPERRSEPLEARERYTARARGRKVAQIRSQAVAEAYENHLGKNLDGIVTVKLRGNREVQLGCVEYLEDEEGRGYVEIWLGKKEGPPAYRVFNPPTLVEDPQGDIEVPGPNGTSKKYREDPLACIAEVVAGQGGKR